MKTRTDLHAGQFRSLTECRQARDYWRTQAKAMQTFAATGRWPADLPYPTTGGGTSGGGSQSQFPYGGYIGGVWVPDQSGVC